MSIYDKIKDADDETKEIIRVNTKDVIKLVRLTTRLRDEVSSLENVMVGRTYNPLSDWINTFMAHYEQLKALVNKYPSDIKEIDSFMVSANIYRQKAIDIFEERYGIIIELYNQIVE